MSHIPSSIAIPNPPHSQSSLSEESASDQAQHRNASLPKVQLNQLASKNAHTITLPIFWLLLAFRLANALAIRTFFQPDEYFQALEPAWQLAFGDDSGAWITWEWRHQLRSTLLPYIFSVVYRTAAFGAGILRLGDAQVAELLITAPKVFQASLAAVGDYYTWRLASLAYGHNSYPAWAALALSILNPFHFFVITRTLSNCTELVLNVAALYFWYTSIAEESGQEAQFSTKFNKGDSRTDLFNERDHARPAKAQHPARGQALTTQITTQETNTPIDVLRLRCCLILAALSCVLRITNVLTWLALAGFKFLYFDTRWHTLATAFSTEIQLPLVRPHLRSLNRDHWILARESILCGSVILASTAVLDRLFYGMWTFPPIRFLYINIAEGVSSFYGVHDYSWYFVQGLPLLLGVFLPSFGQALRTNFLQEPTNTNYAAAVIKYEFSNIAVLVPFVFSFVAHKEVRFIYPLLPIFHILAAGPFASYIEPVVYARSSSLVSRATLRRYFVLVGILLVNVLAAVFITQYHQRAPLSVATFLRAEHETYYLPQSRPISGVGATDMSMTVGFLMPCHSTPWRSHLIYPNIKAWALGCEPPVGMSREEKASYEDEADQFYNRPEVFLRESLGQPPKLNQGFGLHGGQHGQVAWDGTKGVKIWPEYLVFFAEKEAVLRRVLQHSDYVQCWRGWNSWFHDDWRRRGDVVVWCHRRKPLPPKHAVT